MGLHHGSILSSYLFKLIIDKLTNSIYNGLPWSMLIAKFIDLVEESLDELIINLSDEDNM